MLINRTRSQVIRDEVENVVCVRQVEIYPGRRRGEAPVATQLHGQEYSTLFHAGAAWSGGCGRRCDDLAGALVGEVASPLIASINRIIVLCRNESATVGPAR